MQSEKLALENTMQTMQDNLVDQKEKEEDQQKQFDSFNLRIKELEEIIQIKDKQFSDLEYQYTQMQQDLYELEEHNEHMNEIMM